MEGNCKKKCTTSILSKAWIIWSIFSLKKQDYKGPLKIIFVKQKWWLIFADIINFSKQLKLPRNYNFLNLWIHIPPNTDQKLSAFRHLVLLKNVMCKKGVVQAPLFMVIFSSVHNLLIYDRNTPKVPSNFCKYFLCCVRTMEDTVSLFLNFPNY